jgi:hypothetical protein
MMRGLYLVLLLVCVPFVAAEGSIIEDIRDFLQELFLRSSQQNQVTGFVVHEPTPSNLLSAEQVPYDPPVYESEVVEVVIEQEPLPLISLTPKDVLITKLQSTIDQLSEPVQIVQEPITYTLRIEGHLVPQSQIRLFVEPTAENVRYTLRKDDVVAALTSSTYRIPSEGEYTITADFEAEHGFVKLENKFTVGTVEPEIVSLDISSESGTHMVRGPAKVIVTSAEIYSLDMGMYFLAGKKIRIPLGIGEGVIYLPDGLFELDVVQGNN